MAKQILLFFLLGLSLSGCQKTVFERTTKGVVVDATTNEPIPFAQVSLYRETAELLGSSHRELEASVFTNEHGEFEIKFHKTLHGSNTLYAEKDGFTTFSYESDEDVTEPKGRRKVVLKLQPLTTLRIHVRKQIDYHSITIVGLSGVEGMLDKSYSFNSEGVFEHTVYANQNVKLFISRQTNFGNFIQTDTSVFCPLNKVTPLTFNY